MIDARKHLKPLIPRLGIWFLFLALPGSGGNAQVLAPVAPQEGRAVDLEAVDAIFQEFDGTRTPGCAVGVSVSRVRNPLTHRECRCAAGARRDDKA